MTSQFLHRYQRMHMEYGIANCFLQGLSNTFLTALTVLGDNGERGDNGSPTRLHSHTSLTNNQLIIEALDGFLSAGSSETSHA